MRDANLKGKPCPTCGSTERTRGGRCRPCKLAYDRRYRLLHPDKAEQARCRWRDKKNAEGLCSRCGREVWVFDDGLGRAICLTCQNVKQWGRVAWDEAGENPPTAPLRPIQADRPM